MKDIIESVAFAAFVVVAFWELVGLYGISIGSDDSCTRSFVWACQKVGIGVDQ